MREFAGDIFRPTIIRILLPHPLGRNRMILWSKGSFRNKRDRVHTLSSSARLAARLSLKKSDSSFTSFSRPFCPFVSLFLLDNLRFWLTNSLSTCSKWFPANERSLLNLYIDKEYHLQHMHSWCIKFSWSEFLYNLSSRQYFNILKSQRKSS